MTVDATSPAAHGGILVTGASSGIGAATVTVLAAAGFTVGCLSRRGTAPTGERYLPLKASVTDEAAMASAIARVAEAPGGLKGVVNCAGTHTEQASADVKTEDLRAVMDTNFYAAFAINRLAYPVLKAHGGGVIVNIGSFYDRLGVARNVAYAASKAAIASMTRSLAVEWARDGIRVLNVAPGYVRTGLNDEFFADSATLEKVVRRIPARRVGDADEIAQMVAMCFTLKCAFLTGETIYVDGAHGVAL